MKKIHPVQQSLLDLLKAHHDDPLTIRELQERLDISSPSVVHHHLTQLEQKGLLHRNPDNSQDYQIMEDGPEKKIVYLHLYGLAKCGPNGSILSGDPQDKVPISSRLIGFPAGEAFLVKARGDSMQPRIQPGDLVIARRSSTAQSGETVVCVHKGEALIKQVHKEGENVILHSLNARYKPFIAEAGDFKIEGIVRGVMSFGFQ